MSDLQERLLRACHEPDAADLDVENLAHEIARSDDAQAYLVQLVATLTAISPAHAAADRAEALLEHGLAIAAEHDETELAATRSNAKERARDH